MRVTSPSVTIRARYSHSSTPRRPPGAQRYRRGRRASAPPGPDHERRHAGDAHRAVSGGADADRGQRLARAHDQLGAGGERGHAGAELHGVGERRRAAARRPALQAEGEREDEDEPAGESARRRRRAAAEGGAPGPPRQQGRDRDPGQDARPQAGGGVGPLAQEQVRHVDVAVGERALGEELRAVVGGVRVAPQQPCDHRRPAREREGDGAHARPRARARHRHRGQREGERRHGHEVAAEVADGAAPVVGGGDGQVVDGHGGKRGTQPSRSAAGRSRRRRAGGTGT